MVFAACVGVGWGRPGVADGNGEAANPVVSRIIIELKEAPGEGPGEAGKWVELARGMIFLREGEPFSDQRFKASLDALKESGVFREIHVPDPEWGEKEIVMRFHLTPFPRIENIRISGAFPILEREVLNAMTLHVGGAYREKSLPDQEAAIERIFINEGYVAPRVTVSPGADAGDGHLTLNVKIDKGAYYRVKKVEIKGGRSFLDSVLELRINVSKSSMLFRE
ncbi:MAG: hypothetical protein GY859_05935, partial [Desulfobacterales bacterium]|nr:hypothetical protein [Desulfobacterales bacterium]